MMSAVSVAVATSCAAPEPGEAAKPCDDVKAIAVGVDGVPIMQIGAVLVLTLVLVAAVVWTLVTRRHRAAAT